MLNDHQYTFRYWRVFLASKGGNVRVSADKMSGKCKFLFVELNFAMIFVTPRSIHLGNRLP